MLNQLRFYFVSRFASRPSAGMSPARAPLYPKLYLVPFIKRTER
jgi:hypothetical protein